MRGSKFTAVGCLSLLAVLAGRAWGSTPPEPGTVNYVEGQAKIGVTALDRTSVGKATLPAGQSLSTNNGRAELLLAPGIFLRIDHHSSLKMVSPGLADTIMTLQEGRAMVEVAEIRRENNIRISEDGESIRLLKPGLYDFDADRGLISVFDGKAVVQTDDRQIQVKGGHQLNLNASNALGKNAPDKLKAQKFDKKSSMDDFYRWASLRSSYLAEANVDAARRYAGGSGWSPGYWYGDGWYWDPWFDAYTFIPGDGIFFDPFGWGFYSPWFAYGAPYVGYGYGGYGIGYSGYSYPRHFGPGYRPPYMPGGRAPGFAGHAHTVYGGIGGVSQGSGFGGVGLGRASGAGGIHGNAGGFGGGGGLHGGGGFHGAGGGFHGGGHGR